MKTAEVPYTHDSWTVQRNEDGNYDIIDPLGDIANEAFSLEDAIEACDDAVDACYRERLWSAIQNADPDDLHLGTLAAMVRLLGLDPDTI